MAHNAYNSPSNAALRTNQEKRETRQNRVAQTSRTRFIRKCESAPGQPVVEYFNEALSWEFSCCF